MNAEQQKKNKIVSILMKTEVSMVAIIAIIFIATSLGTQNFLTAYNLTNILKQCAIIGIISIAETYVIITAGIDISCGAIVGMSTLIVAMSQAKWGLSVPVSLLLGILIAIISGVFNAALVYEFRVPAFVATLGSQTILRGLIKVISNGGTVAGINKAFAGFASASFGFIPNLAIVWFVIAVICFLILKYTIFGRNLFVLGSGEEVAKLNGISIRKTIYSTYAFAGLLYGIAGILLCARINSAIPTAGEAYETNAIAASVLGGASLAGGKVSFAGAYIAAIIIVMIRLGLTTAAIQTEVQSVIIGLILILAVAFNNFVASKKTVEM